MVDLRCRHHDSRGDLLSLAGVLRIIEVVVRDLRAESALVAGFVNRYLAYMMLLNDTGALIGLKAGICPHALHSII